MTQQVKEKADFIKYSNLIPITMMVVTGLVQLVWYLTSQRTDYTLLRKDIEIIKETLIANTATPNENRQSIQKIQAKDIEQDLRLQRLEDYINVK